jgi:hypothetical protein
MHGTKNTIDSQPIRKALQAFSFIAVAGCIAVFIPIVRSALTGFGETLVRRQLNQELWNYQLLFMACAGLFGDSKPGGGDKASQSRDMETAKQIAQNLEGI